MVPIERSYNVRKHYKSKADLDAISVASVLLAECSKKVDLCHLSSELFEILLLLKLTSWNYLAALTNQDAFPSE